METISNDELPGHPAPENLISRAFLSTAANSFATFSTADDAPNPVLSIAKVDGVGLPLSVLQGAALSTRLQSTDREGLWRIPAAAVQIVNGKAWAEWCQGVSETLIEDGLGVCHGRWRLELESALLVQSTFNGSMTLSDMSLPNAFGSLLVILPTFDSYGLCLSRTGSKSIDAKVASDTPTRTLQAAWFHGTDFSIKVTGFILALRYSLISTGNYPIPAMPDMVASIDSISQALVNWKADAAIVESDAPVMLTWVLENTYKPLSKCELVGHDKTRLTLLEEAAEREGIPLRMYLVQVSYEKYGEAEDWAEELERKEEGQRRRERDRQLKQEQKDSHDKEMHSMFRQKDCKHCDDMVALSQQKSDDLWEDLRSSHEPDTFDDDNGSSDEKEFHVMRERGEDAKFYNLTYKDWTDMDGNCVDGMILQVDRQTLTVPEHYFEEIEDTADPDWEYYDLKKQGALQHSYFPTAIVFWPVDSDGGPESKAMRPASEMLSQVFTEHKVVRTSARNPFTNTIQLLALCVELNAEVMMNYLLKGLLSAIPTLHNNLRQLTPDSPCITLLYKFKALLTKHNIPTNRHAWFFQRLVEEHILPSLGNCPPAPPNRTLAMPGIVNCTCSLCRSVSSFLTSERQSASWGYRASSIQKHIGGNLEGRASLKVEWVPWNPCLTTKKTGYFELTKIISPATKIWEAKLEVVKGVMGELGPSLAGPCSGQFKVDTSKTPAIENKWTAGAKGPAETTVVKKSGSGRSSSNSGGKRKRISDSGGELVELSDSD